MHGQNTHNPRTKAKQESVKYVRWELIHDNIYKHVVSVVSLFIVTKNLSTYKGISIRDY